MTCPYCHRPVPNDDPDAILTPFGELVCGDCAVSPFGDDLDQDQSTLAERMQAWRDWAGVR